MPVRWWMMVPLTLAFGCGGDGSAGVSDAVVTVCATSCEELESFDECSEDLQSCIDECEAVASAYDEDCGVCLAQNSTSFAADGCSDNYPGCEDDIRCEYTIASAGEPDCSSACE